MEKIKKVKERGILWSALSNWIILGIDIHFLG